MAGGSDLLIAHGFKKEKIKGEYPGANPTEIKTNIREKIKTLKGENLKTYLDTLRQDADHDQIEIAKNQLISVEYPKPVNKYSVVYETPQQSLEPLYFWSLNHLKYDLGFGWVEKITDVFSASEHSSFWGAATSRLGLTQDKVQSYLALIGQFIRKDLFQLIRDIRWIDERLDFHKDAKAGKTDAIIVLKGIWTDLVDGVVQGQRTGQNVFGMQSQLGFTSLPDLFFSTHPKTTDDIDAAVNAISTTQPVASVLKRKLRDFMTWQVRNNEELVQRKKFELTYLRQHYNIIKLYLQWIKPYLTHMERLGADISKVSSADLIGSFEGNMINIEIVGAKLPEGGKEKMACIVLSFEYRTRPQLGGPFVQETPGYHKGPIYVGEAKINWRAYAWTADQIEAFKQVREREDLETLKNIDSSVRYTLDALGDDLWKYLKEAETAGQAPKEEAKKEEPKKVRPPGVFDPFLQVGKGAGDLFSAFFPKKEDKPKSSGGGGDDGKKASDEAAKMLYVHYKNFKKSHGLAHW